jgi:hypothetical protein
MAEVFRSLVGRLNDSVKGYFKPSRKRSSLPVRIEIIPDFQTTGQVIIDPETGLAGKRRKLTIAGETADISATGISFFVNFIRVGQHYLVSEGTRLKLEVDLPAGMLCLDAIGCRYENIDIDSSVSKFLVGARITKISAADKKLLEDHLHGKHLNGVKINGARLGLELPEG